MRNYIKMSWPSGQLCKNLQANSCWLRSRITAISYSIRWTMLALLITLLAGCGNPDPDSSQSKTADNTEFDSFQNGTADNYETLKDAWDGNYYINSIGEQKDFGISTEEIKIDITGLEKEYTFLWLSDLHIITENDEIAAEDLETVAGRRESFKNAVGMCSDEFWLQLSEALDVWGADALFFGGDMIDHAANANIACLKEGLDKLETPYLYVRADHDYAPYYCAVKDETAVAKLHSEIDGYKEISLIELEDLCLVGINNSTKPVSAAALQEMKDICSKGKSIILITHVPLNSLCDTSLEEESKAVWDGRALIWGTNCTYVPDGTTQEFMDLIYAEDSPVKEVLAGHLHFTWDGQLTENTGEHIFSPAHLGNVGVVRVGDY